MFSQRLKNLALRGSNSGKEKSTNAQNTTSEDEDKKYKLIKKLTSHSADQFRELDINEFDLNFTEHFEQLQYIDDAVTPLIYCAHHGLKQILRFLLRNNNVDVDMETTNNKQTALIVACQNANYEIIRHLILAKAEVNKPNAFNINPLATVLYRLVEEDYSFQNKKICFLISEYLINNGADPNWIVEKTRGYSILHYFCSSKMKMNKTQKMINEDIISFLLNHGANPQLKTLKDQNAFDLIKTHCNRQRIQKLLNDWKERNQSQKAKSLQPQKKKFKSLTEEFLKIQIKPKAVTQIPQQKSVAQNVQQKIVSQKPQQNTNKSRQQVSQTQSSQPKIQKVKEQKAPSQSQQIDENQCTKHKFM